MEASLEPPLLGGRGRDRAGGGRNGLSAGDLEGAGTLRQVRGGGFIFELGEGNTALVLSPCPETTGVATRFLSPPG